jgi:hypothetical protein
MRKTVWMFVVLAAAGRLQAQTIEDGVMMPKETLCGGVVYMHDSWETYWEGELKRDNGNIGTLTTQSVALMGTYGVTDRLNLIAMLPFVWTGASQGVLHGMSGLQDATFAAKYTLLEKPFVGHSSARLMVVGSAGTPVGDYTPDFLPFSIGMQSSRVSGRVTARVIKKGFFATASTAYTWRGNVTLDRPAYFTEGQLFLTDEVRMPNVFDYAFSVGYYGKRLYVPISYMRQDTRGGSDIRRQDMPFVSNRMDFSRIEGSVQYFLPWPQSRDLSVKLGAARVLSGRNVGQSTTITGGLLYTFRF